MNTELLNICIDKKIKIKDTYPLIPMQATITDYRIKDEQKKYIDLFQLMADTITDEYIEYVTASITSRGVSPSFEEVMNFLKALNDELTFRSYALRERFRSENGRRSTKLTRNCEKIIKNSVEGYTKKVLTMAKLS